MTLLQLKYAVTVADTGSITAGAEKLFIAQPSRSKVMNVEGGQHGEESVFHR